MKTTSLPDETSLLEDKCIVLGVSGGVAAYKAVELCRHLTARRARVVPVLTHNAMRFVGVATFRALATEEPVTDLWTDADPSPHTTLARSADLVVVAPATARVIASLAHGMSDDVLATTLIATRAPIVVCPAMHTEMWENPAVAGNVSLLRSRGIAVVEPQTGALAGGDTGVGRLADVDTIVTAVARAFVPQDLAGKSVLVSAGGTREPIDPVRYIGNRSSGKQGHAIAVAAARRGADVTLVTAGNVRSVDVATFGEMIQVQTAAEMHRALISRLGAADLVVMAAAVADFRPRNPAGSKMKKADGIPKLELEPTVDILQAIVQQRRPNQVVVGFAAETDDVITNAAEKLRQKGVDLIAANDVTRAGAGFGSDSNDVTIIGAGGETFATGLVDKTTVADALLDRAAVLLASR